MRTDTKFFCDSRVVLDAHGLMPAFAYQLDHTVGFLELDRCFGGGWVDEGVGAFVRL